MIFGFILIDIGSKERMAKKRKKKVKGNQTKYRVIKRKLFLKLNHLEVQGYFALRFKCLLMIA